MLENIAHVFWAFDALLAFFGCLGILYIARAPYSEDHS